MKVNSPNINTVGTKITTVKSFHFFIIHPKKDVGKFPLDFCNIRSSGDERMGGNMAELKLIIS